MLQAYSYLFKSTNKFMLRWSIKLYKLKRECIVVLTRQLFLELRNNRNGYNLQIK